MSTPLPLWQPHTSPCLSSLSPPLRKRRISSIHQLPVADTLHQIILNFFTKCQYHENWEESASAKFNCIKSTVLNSHWTATKVETDEARRRLIYTGGSYVVLKEDTCWTLCYSVASLVMVLAAPQLLAGDALRFPGHDTRDEIAGQASVNLRHAITNARTRARSSDETTILCVGLLDDTDQSRRYNVAYVSFSHWFVMVVDPQGLRIYQSWYEQYTLLEWLQNDGARLRPWREIDTLLDHFDTLSHPQDQWTDSVNAAYKACFAVDMNNIRSQSSRNPYVLPQCAYQPHFVVSRLDDVKDLDLRKFRWECEDQASAKCSKSHSAAPVMSGPYRRSH